MQKRGRIKSCLTYLILLTSFACFSKAPEVYAESVSKPLISLPQPVHEFESVIEGSKVEHDFILQNKGGASLNINRIVSGCGCTAVAPINEPIAPGEETTVKVTFDTLGMAGKQNKSVRIYSNDPDNPISVVTIKGHVDRPVIVEPRNIFFKDVIRGKTDRLEREVKVKLGNVQGVRIAAVKTFSKHLSIEDLSGNDKEKKFKVVVDGNLPMGDFRDRVIVTLSGAAKSSVNIPVYANVKGNLQLSPPTLSFGIISGDTPLVRKVRVENNSDKAYVLKEVRSSNPALSAKIEELTAGKSYLVEVKLDPAKVTQDLRSELKFTADSELTENLVMNVYGVMPPKL